MGTSILGKAKNDCKKKRKSTYFFKNKREYLRVYLKSMNWDVQESLESCKLRIWEFLQTE